MKRAPTADQLKQYFICDNENTTGLGNGQVLYLATNVSVEVAKGRPYSASTDATQDVDPSQTVYPIRGSFDWWQCSGGGPG